MLDQLHTKKPSSVPKKHVARAGKAMVVPVAKLAAQSHTLVQSHAAMEAVVRARSGGGVAGRVGVQGGGGAEGGGGGGTGGDAGSGRDVVPLSMAAARRSKESLDRAGRYMVAALTRHRSQLSREEASQVLDVQIGDA